MTDKVVVLVSVGNLKEARKIARGVVASGLAACVTVSGPVDSVYRWQGQIDSSRERLLVIKTSREAFRELEAAIRRMHSYAVPEIVSLPIIDGSRDYLEWLDQSLKIDPAPALALAEKPARKS
jgi:periplasmic divalent cation tolerance protein